MQKPTRVNLLILLILVLIVVPAADFILLLAAGGRIGWLTTLALAVLTGIIGAGLAKQQGMRTWIEIRHSLSRGQLPSAPLLEGAMILFAGAVLLTPGFITDAVGFLLLVPLPRRWLAGRVVAHFRKRMQANQEQQSANGNAWNFSAQWSTKTAQDDDEIIDMDPSSVTEDVPPNLKGRED
ncbi:MAG: FxsA family protein [Lentisphaeria bacterium]